MSLRYQQSYQKNNLQSNNQYRKRLYVSAYTNHSCFNLKKKLESNIQGVFLKYHFEIKRKLVDYFSS